MMIHRFGIFVLLTLTVAGCSNSPQQPKSMALSFAQKCLEDLTDSLVAPKTLEIESFSVSYLPYNPNSLYEAKVYQDQYDLITDILDYESSKRHNSYTTKHSVIIKYHAENTMGVPLVNYELCEFITEKTSTLKKDNYYTSLKSIKTNDDGTKSLSYFSKKDPSLFEELKFKLNNTVSIDGEEGSFSEEQLEEKSKILREKRHDSSINLYTTRSVNITPLEDQSLSTKQKYTLKLSEIILALTESKTQGDIDDFLKTRFYWSTESNDSVQSFKHRKGQFHLDLNGDGRNVIIWDAILEKDRIIGDKDFSLTINAPDEYCFNANTVDRKSNKFMHCNISFEQLIKEIDKPHDELCKDRTENDFGYGYGKYRILGNSKILITSEWDGGSGGVNQIINITSRNIKGDPCSPDFSNKFWWEGHGDRIKIDAI